MEKTLESPLNRKEIKPINPRGNQPWIFTARTDAEAKAPILWSFGHLMRSTDSLEKTWMLRKTEGRRRRGNRGWDGWMAWRLFVNYTSIKPGKIFAFQLHNSHWWCLQDLSLGKDVDLFLYPVSSLVPKLVLVIQFSLWVIKPPLEMGLGHTFCHFSPQNAYFENKRRRKKFLTFLLIAVESAWDCWNSGIHLVSMRRYAESHAGSVKGWRELWA